MFLCKVDTKQKKKQLSLSKEFTSPRKLNGAHQSEYIALFNLNTLSLFFVLHSVPSYFHRSFHLTLSYTKEAGEWRDLKAPDVPAGVFQCSQCFQVLGIRCCFRVLRSPVQWSPETAHCTLSVFFLFCYLGASRRANNDTGLWCHTTWKLCL